APDPDARPTARALAAAVHQRVPTARLPRPAGPPQLLLDVPRPARAARPLRAGRREAPPAASPLSRPGTRRPPPSPADPREPAAVRGARPAEPARPGPASGRPAIAGWVAAVVAGGAVLVAALALLPGALRNRRPPAYASLSPAAEAVAGTSAGGRKSTPAAGGGSTTSARAPVAVRVWPPEPLDFRDGVLTFEGARYALGRPGDAVVAGDWDCSGGRTLALFRPGTGEVFAFPGWPGEGAATTARALGTVVGATGVRVVDADGDGCDDLEVARAGHGPVHLEPAA
ncbi:MAG: hypothetical protein ACR2MO_04420, partial [Acidimicrobiales bacterium]